MTENLGFAPVDIMVDKGFDRAHGIKVNFTTGGSSTTIPIDTVASGQIDMAWSGVSGVLAAIHSGGPIEIASPVAGDTVEVIISKKAMEASGVSPNAPIAQRVHALKGLRIATIPPGGTFTPVLEDWLKKYGLDPNRDVTLDLVSQPSAMISGLEQGRYDAIVNGIGDIEPAITAGAGTLWISGPAGNVKDTLSDSQFSAMVMNPSFVSNHGAALTDFLAAMKESLTYIADHRDAAGQLLYKDNFSSLSPAIWKIMWAQATNLFPTQLVYPKSSFNAWMAEEPGGAAAFSNVTYTKAVYKGVRQSGK